MSVDATGLPAAFRATAPLAETGRAVPGADGAAFTSALDAAQPTPVVQRASFPVVSPAQGSTGTLGDDVLRSLERFGRSVNSLQKMGVEAQKSVEALQASRSLPAGPASAAITPGGSATRVATQTDMAEVFKVAMSDQARLYGVMTEVCMGRSVGNSLNQTVKTLLTQNG